MMRGNLNVTRDSLQNRTLPGQDGVLSGLPTMRPKFGVRSVILIFPNSSISVHLCAVLGSAEKTGVVPFMNTRPKRFRNEAPKHHERPWHCTYESVAD
jgi:hypothetical protein